MWLCMHVLGWVGTVLFSWSGFSATMLIYALSFLGGDPATTMTYAACFASSSSFLSPSQEVSLTHLYHRLQHGTFMCMALYHACLYVFWSAWSSLNPNFFLFLSSSFLLGGRGRGNCACGMQPPSLCLYLSHALCPNMLCMCLGARTLTGNLPQTVPAACYFCLLLPSLPSLWRGV